MTECPDYALACDWPPSYVIPFVSSEFSAVFKKFILISFDFYTLGPFLTDHFFNSVPETISVSVFLLFCFKFHFILLHYFMMCPRKHFLHFFSFVLNLIHVYNVSCSNPVPSPALHLLFPKHLASTFKLHTSLKKRFTFIFLCVCVPMSVWVIVLNVSARPVEGSTSSWGTVSGGFEVTQGSWEQNPDPHSAASLLRWAPSLVVCYMN